MIKSQLITVSITLSLLGSVLLSGCAGVVVGGAATGVAVAHDRRSTGVVIDDKGTDWKISEAISRDKELKELSHVSITVYNGAALLTGETPSEDLKLRANAITAQIIGDKPVYNELVIASPTTLGVRTNDTYITTKVKTALFNINTIEGFDFTRVKVVTENGVVFLMGLLTTQEADAVTDQARNVSGVKKVVKLFEYI